MPVPALECPKDACCDAETFWAAFMAQWRKRFNQDADTPDFICQPAWSYWRQGLTGYEAAETCFRRLAAGKM